jgi:hypothetical protein
VSARRGADFSAELAGNESDSRLPSLPMHSATVSMTRILYSELPKAPEVGTSLSPDSVY